jgi:hypothetical protein
MLDTNIFDRLAKGSLDIGDLPCDGEFFATSIQIKELNQTKDEALRNSLNKIFAGLGPTLDQIQTTLWDFAGWGEGGWSAKGEYFEEIKADLDSLNRSKRSNSADALIGEVSLSNHHTLITTDKHLAEVVERHGGKVKRVEDYK